MAWTLDSDPILGDEARHFRRAALWILVLAMAGQLLTVPPAVRHLRRLPPQTEADYEWIRRHTPPDSRFLYNQESLVALTGRPVVWAAAIPRYIFSTGEREQTRVLRYLQVQYIAIHPTRRIKDWTPDVEPTGYPESWLETLPGHPYLERVYPPGQSPPPANRFVIYRIHYDRMPQEWIRDVRPGA
ncbi:MAG: hypothetical protein WBD52_01000 [Phycisphaerae bacterium]